MRSLGNLDLGVSQNIENPEVHQRDQEALPQKDITKGSIIEGLLSQEVDQEAMN
jgi:hypothetical protein